MNTLATLESRADLPALLIEDVASARRYQAAGKAPGTHKVYAAAWAAFTGYCDARSLVALPAEVGTVMVFLSAEADGGAKASTLGLRVSAIRHKHQDAGHPSPTESKEIRGLMQGIRRTIGAAPQSRAPVPADKLAAMLAACPDTLKGKRDRALLALGFAGAFRRSELVALTVADLVPDPAGYRVRIAKSKGDQEGRGQEIAIPHGGKLKPVEAVRAWLQAAGITEGPVFRRVGKGGMIGGALSADSVPDLVKHYAALVPDLDPARVSAHSLRSGFLTSGAAAGASVFKLMEVSRHKRIATLAEYVKGAELFKDHAGGSFL